MAPQKQIGKTIRARRTPKVTRTDSPTAAQGPKRRGASVPRTTRGVLSRAADLVECGWCQRGFAMRGDMHASYTDPRADRFCAKGAIAAVAQPGNLRRMALLMLASVMPPTEGGECPVAAFNDAPERTQAEVVAKLREAAALATHEAHRA